eukprot:2932477-Rhodomonas_salina.1
MISDLPIRCQQAVKYSRRSSTAKEAEWGPSAIRDNQTMDWYISAGLTDIPPDSMLPTESDIRLSVQPSQLTRNSAATVSAW